MKNNRSLFTKRTISNMIVVAFGVLLYLALSHFAAIRTTAGWVMNVLSPFITGIGLAYILNLPMSWFESKVFYKRKRKRGLSLVTVYLLAIVIVGVVLGLVVPQVVESITMLVRNISGYLSNFNDLITWVEESLGLEGDIFEILAISYTDVVTQLTTFARAALPEVVNYTVRLGSGIVSILTAFIASLYMLASKDKLLVQTRRVMYAIFPQKRADNVYRVARLSNKMFSGFIGGKLLDSLIIGVICYVFMTVMNLWVYEMPFAPLISVVIGITNIVPFFGPFIGAIPSVMILLLVNPWSALWFIVFVIVLQQFDGNFLGPKILGDSTGLPALWVLIAIVLGGGFFGFAGMLFGVPTAAVLYTLASDFIDKRLKHKKLNRQANPVAAGEDEAAAPPEDDNAGEDFAPGPSTSVEADEGMD